MKVSAMTVVEFYSEADEIKSISKPYFRGQNHSWANEIWPNYS